MKKQYILVALVLIGLGVISTMAFTLNAGPNVQTEVYNILDEGANGTITKIKAKPKGSLDKVDIDIQLTDQEVAFDLDINLLGSSLNLTGATISASSGAAGLHDVGPGENIIYYTNIPGGSGTTTWTLTIDATSGYVGANTVWEDITSLLVTLADY